MGALLLLAQFMQNIKNTKILDLGVLAISTYISDHYMEISEENYFLLDSLKKQMVEHRNKLKSGSDHDCKENRKILII